jgi:hypothetical protein
MTAAVLRKAPIWQTDQGQKIYTERAMAFPFRRWFELDQADANIGCSGGVIRSARAAVGVLWSRCGRGG